MWHSYYAVHTLHCLKWRGRLQAQLSAKLARRQRELEEEDAERKRRDAAAAKLRALDEAIAAREAERWADLPCSISSQSMFRTSCAGVKVLNG